MNHKKPNIKKKNSMAIYEVLFMAMLFFQSQISYGAYLNLD